MQPIIHFRVLLIATALVVATACSSSSERPATIEREAAATLATQTATTTSAGISPTAQASGSIGGSDVQPSPQPSAASPAGATAAAPRPSATPVARAGGSPGGTVVAEPCTLVTQAEAEQATGAKLSPGATTGGIGLRQCEYGGERATVYVSIYVGVNTAEQAYRSWRTESGTRAQDVPGLGESAFWENGLRTLDVLAKGQYLVITVASGFGTSDAALAAATAMAKIAIARL